MNDLTDQSDSTIKRVHATLRQQMASTKMWVSKYHQYKDASSIRNASFACGLLLGKHQIAELMIGKENIEPEILEAVNEYADVWNNELM